MNFSQRVRLAFRSAVVVCSVLFVCNAEANAPTPTITTAVATQPSAAAAESVPTVITTAKRMKHKRLRKPLVLSLPRFSFENIAISSTVSGSFNSSVNYLQREMHSAHHVVEDISLFRLRLSPEWSLQWDFNRQTQAADRVLALNVGLYHDF